MTINSYVMEADLLCCSVNTIIRCSFFSRSFSKYAITDIMNIEKNVNLCHKISRHIQIDSGYDSIDYYASANM